MKLVYINTLIFLLFIISSCNSGNYYSKYTEIPDNIWNVKNKVEYTPSIIDTTAIFNIYIHVRNTGEYPMSNLFLFVKTTSPQGFFVKDTFECTMADHKGKWLGKGFGSIWNNKFLFKANVRFPYSGEYKFNIEQAMRIDDLPGIVDVGLSIEEIDY